MARFLSLSPGCAVRRATSHLVEHELGGRAPGGETGAPRLLKIEPARQPVGVEQLHHLGRIPARRQAGGC